MGYIVAALLFAALGTVIITIASLLPHWAEGFLAWMEDDHAKS
jgi:hypothetical protein